jgi:predicted dehydrogenase
MGLIHSWAYMNNGSAEVVSVCDSDEAAVDRFTRGPWKRASWLPEEDRFLQPPVPKYEVGKTYTDYREVAVDPDIDAVSICLPDTMHAAAAKLMLENGKHVLLEKPMAPSVRECEELIELSQKNKTTLMVAHMWRFHPEVCYVRKAVDEGLIGQVVKTKGYAVYVREAPSGWYVQRKYAGGGPLLNVGVHAVDTVRFILGEPKAERVYASVKSVYGDYDVDDMAVVVIEFAGGTVSIIETGQNHPYADGLEASTQLFGTEGYARVFPTELQYRVGGIWGSHIPDIEVPHISPSMFQEEVDHFVHCIEGDEEPLIGGETAMENVRIIEAAYRASDSGEIVNVHA